MSKSLDLTLSAHLRTALTTAFGFATSSDPRLDAIPFTTESNLRRSLADELARLDPFALALNLANAGLHRYRGII